MKRAAILFAVIMVLALNIINAQPIVKAWDYRYGGTRGETPKSIYKLNYGGYVVGGFSLSGMNGNKSQPNWSTGELLADYWLIRTDSNGNKVWDKRFGGTGEDGMFSMALTLDEGFILGGYSLSNISGDKTQNNWGGADYWVVKVDKDGNKQWDKRYGGTGNDFLWGKIISTSDGGYLLGGQSNSNISGDKSEAVRGGNSLYDDYWVVKIDSLGNKQWDKTYGGNNQESLTSLLETADGGYLIGGYSKSGISGDKTEENIGGFDFWLVKIDSLGNKVWDKSYGTINSDGIYSICKTHDGNYILGGGRYIKVDDNGDEFWTKSFIVCAGTNDIKLTSDKGFLISGTVRNICSVPTPDQTETNLGDIQTLIIKTDSAFNKQWDKTVFSTGEDYEGMAIEAGNGCYVIASDSRSGIGGYKSQPNWDATNQWGDFWIVKLCEDPNFIPVLTKDEGVSVVVYPNPIVNEVAIALQQEQVQEATYVLTTIDGKILYHQHETHLAPGYTKILDLSTLPSGVYLITVNINGENITKQVVKK